MSDQPFKNDNSKHQHFQLRPAAAQIHRLGFSVRSTSHNIHVRGHSDTNSSGRNNKNRTHSNNSIKVTSGIRDQSNYRNLEPRAGSAFSFQSTTNIASSADRTMISYPRPTAPAPTLVRQVPSIESSASSSRPPPLTSSRTSAKRPGKAPPEHRLAMAVEQAQTPPKSLIVRLPEEPTMHLKNTTTAPNISVPAFSAPSALDLALHRQHSPPRVSSDISFGCSRPAAHYSSVPALPPRPEGVEHAFAHQLTEHVSHRSQELTDKKGFSERSLQPASDNDLDAITNITHTTMPKEEEEEEEEEPSSTSQTTKLSSSSSSSVVFPSIASLAVMPSHRWREALSPSSSRAVLAHAPQRKSVDLPDISAMLMDRTVMKQQWIESEQLLFSLVGELQMRVKEESDKYQSAQQKIQATSASNAALQARNSLMQTDVAVMEARVADLKSRVQELDADRKRQAEVYEASRSQMATQIASVRQGSMEASFVLEGLATDKSRWEAEVAALRANMQTMEIERGESSLLRASHDHLTESFSVCSDRLKDIQTAYNNVQRICESRQEEANQYRTKCESLSDQLRYLSDEVEELNRENDERRVANEALQVTNHSMSDQIEFLKQACGYQKCRESNADELSKIKNELTEAKELVEDVAVLESRVREGALKAEELTTRNAQLDAELRTLKEGTARYQEVITQLQEVKRQLESENQRLIQSSMSAQADYVIELNATVERCEELRQCQANESQTVIDDKDAHIGELTRHLETKTREFQKLAGEKQQLSELLEYQAQTATATDREMLELRVKIQLLQSDHEIVAKARDDLEDELEALRRAHEAQQQLMQQQSVMPMPLTDIVRLHSREYDGGGVGSASVTDFLQWPVDLGTPLSARHSSRTDTGVAALCRGSESPSLVSLLAHNARAPSTLAAARSNTKTSTAAAAATSTSAAGSPGSRSRGVTTPSSSSTTPPAATAAVLAARTSSSNDPAAAAVTAAGQGEKRSLKRKRTANESGCRTGRGGVGGAGDSEASSHQEGDLEAAESGLCAGPSTSTSTSAGGVGVGASTAKARRTYSKRLAQQLQQPPQTGPSPSSTLATAASTPATRKSSRGK
ncbi:hypothetical protein K457DRAFT_17295 [Linnemannia elongata AG-77]|uniref:Uncharacterized protein n=1 Tax=Linnemannia elongata AG-77 TaxID=1314771 RepID=A0A197K275_9FUNG|nr:hypothetical protein K457DRAFT_17295 [Linnemannia elongata AG-77]